MTGSQGRESWVGLPIAQRAGLIAQRAGPIAQRAGPIGQADNAGWL